MIWKYMLIVSCLVTALTFVIVLGFIAGSYPKSFLDESTFVNPIIPNGTVVKNRTQFAYQASLRNKSSNTHLCGATILDSRHVLTASQCCWDQRGLLYPPNALTIVVGDLNVLRPSRTTITKYVERVFAHYPFNPKVRANDIAVLRIMGSFESWTPTVKPISLASYLPPGNTNCIVSGWLALREYSTGSADLYQVNIPILDNKTCTGSYGHRVKDGMFCARYAENWRDRCQGDTGGPLVCNGKLTGIASWTNGCGRPRYPGVYTDVSKYLNWISEQQRKR